MAAKNMYPVKKNNWSFRATMIPIPGDGFDPNKALAQPLQELPDELRKRSRVSIFKPPKKVAKEKKHIFQKLEDNRHQSAFKRFQYHARNYEESKDLAMKQTDKVEEDILMENINLYRLKQENILVLEKSKSEEDKYRAENTWEISLRDYWLVEPDIGDLKAVPMPYDLLAQRTLERIGNPLKENMSLDYFTKSDSRADTRKSRWGPFELFMERLEKGIRTTVPHRPDFHGFQLVGNKIKPEVERVKKGERLKFRREGAEPAPDVYSQPAIKLSTESLLFTAKAGEIASHDVKMRNVGTVAVFYSWKRKYEDPLVEKNKTWTESNFQVPRRNRFTVLESAGRILPGEVKNFRFNFLSTFAGSFFETWVLYTSPLLPDPPAPIYFKGVATVEDLNGDRRDALTRELQFREMMRGVGEVIEFLLDDSFDLTSTTLKNKPDYLYSPAAYAFLRGNRGSVPPMYHNPVADAFCQKLVSSINTVLFQEAESRKPPVEEVPATPPPPPKKGAPPPPPPPPPPEPEPVLQIEWDGSLPNVVKASENITSEETRNELLHALCPKIKDSAEIPAHPSSTFHLAIFNIFSESIHPVHDAIENTLAEIAAKIKAEEDARLEARRQKAIEEGLDPEMLEEEEPPPAPPPEYDENGDEIPPPPPPKLYDNVAVTSAVKSVLFESMLKVEDEIEKLQDAAISVVESQIAAQKAREPNEQTLWNIFALEREKMFLVLGKDTRE